MSKHLLMDLRAAFSPADSAHKESPNVPAKKRVSTQSPPIRMRLKKWKHQNSALSALPLVFPYLTNNVSRNRRNIP